MAFSLSVLSRCFGYEKTRAVISHETNREKVQMLLLAGTEIWVNKEPICPDPHSDESGIRIAEKTAHRSGWKTSINMPTRIIRADIMNFADSKS